MYDSWAVYTKGDNTYFLGNEVGGYHCPFGELIVENNQNNIEKTMSYAVHRLLSHGFINSPNTETPQARFDQIMDDFGYDRTFTSTDYSGGSVAAFGNYIAEHLVSFGLQDGSNEENSYENIYYTTINESLYPDLPDNPNISDLNRWQPLTLDFFIDQAGNLILGNTPEFLSLEWGNVIPF